MYVNVYIHIFIYIYIYVYIYIYIYIYVLLLLFPIGLMSRVALQREFQISLKQSKIHWKNAIQNLVNVK